MNRDKGTGCGCSSNAVTEEFKLDNGTSAEEAKKAAKKTLDIDFLYLDLSACQPCQGSEANLDQALAEVAGVLEKTGASVNVQKIHIESFEQAVGLGFVSSPTIRVNGRDVQLEVKENHCQSCSELSGKSTDCRVWVYQGREYQAAPKELTIESVLKEVYGGAQNSDTVVASANKTTRSLENLKEFFESREKGEKQVAAKVPEGCGCAG